MDAMNSRKQTLAKMTKVSKNASQNGEGPSQKVLGPSQNGKPPITYIKPNIKTDEEAATPFQQFKKGILLNIESVIFNDEIEKVSDEYLSLKPTDKDFIEKNKYLKNCFDFLNEQKKLKEKNSAKKEIEVFEEVEYLPTTTEEVIVEIKKQAIVKDTPENRMLVWKIIEPFLESESFKTIWEFQSDLVVDVDKMELMKIWVLRADWFTIKQMRINKLSNWIKNQYRENLKNKKSAYVTNKRKAKNFENGIDPELQKEVYEEGLRRIKNGTNSRGFQTLDD